MGKIIVFDLYDTLVKGITFDFDKGVEYLYQSYFTKHCSWEEFLAYSKTFLPMYNARKEHHTEISFINEELPLYFEKFSVPEPKDLEAVEYEFLVHMKEDMVLDEVRETLEGLKQKEIPMYVLSNSVFMWKTARKHLETHGINHYFKRLYSSGDYGVRKPGKAFFQIAIEEILAENQDTTIEDIFFVGNDYEADAVGGTNAGLKTIWYNVNHQPNEKDLNIWDIDDFRRILNII